MPRIDPRGARLDRRAHRLDRPQAAAVLDGHAALAGDPRQVLERPRLAGARAVEVDDVQLPRARRHPVARGVQRVVAVDGLVLEAALAQPDGPAALDVDRRVEDHARAPARRSP